MDALYYRILMSILKEGCVLLEDYIRLCRIASGLSQTALAKRAHISLTTIRALENHGRVPTLRVYIRFAKAFGVSIDELAGDSGAWVETAVRKLSGNVE
jgi:transcriptional regulator with XRE-family HTH domain